MEQGLKQRLVGAGVIVALGIVFIPMLLDGAGERQLRRIPPSPQAEQTSRPGFIKEKAIPVPVNRQPGQIVLRLPDEPVRSSAQQPVKKNKTASPQPVKAARKQEPVKKAATSKPVSTKTKKVIAKSAPVIKKPVEKIVLASDQNTNKVTKKPVANDLNSQWVVQIGSFTDAKKAFSLRDSLRKKKYKGFVDTVKGRTGRKLYRVRVGPVARHEQALLLSKKLKSEGNAVFVTRHR